MQRFVAIDSETALILPGNLAPPLVCLSIAERNPQTNEVETDLLLRDDAIARYHVLLRDPSVHIVIHNAAFDLGVAANEDQSLLTLIFDAYREGRIHCTIALQKLIDVAAGMRKFRRKDGVITKASYTLQSLVDWYYQEQLEKEETWRLSYALLKDVSLTRWPADAKKYAIYDAIWHLKVFEAQQKYIKDRFGELPNQVDTQRAAWVLHLIGMQGVRADKPAVDHFIKTCEIEINKMHNDLYNLCVKCGFDQENHNTSNCSSFENTNIFRKDKKGKFVRNMSEVRRRVEASFAAMQLDVPKTNPSKKFLEGQTRTDRETLEATQDPNLHILAASMTFQKHLDQWGPVCSAAVLRPVCARYDVMMETGRTSCSGSEGQEGTNFQNPPRKGDVRPCFIPRPGYVFCSTDADTIELRALAQCLLELIGWSKMADALLDQHKNKGPDLHLRLAASLMGIDPYEGLRRKNEGDVEIGEGRQFAKCFHPDVEILTRNNGWVRMRDLTLDHEVASVYPLDPNIRNAPTKRRDPITGRYLPAFDVQPPLKLPEMRIEWVKPQRLTTRKATDGLLHLSNENISLRVTPDHKMLVYGYTKKLDTVDAAAFGNQRGWFSAGLCDEGALVVDERILRLAVATQADGSYIVNGIKQRRVRFGFSKKRKIDRLLSLLRDDEYSMKIGFAKTKKVTSFSLNRELSEKIQQLLDKNKTLPWWWLGLTPDLRKVVIEEAAFWDSYIISSHSYSYCSVIKKNYDVLQAICVITGHKATLYNKTRAFELSVKNRIHTRGGNLVTRKLDYFDDVYCLTVDSGCVLVRDGGKPVITHQCPNFGYPGGLGAETMISYAAALLDKKTHQKWFGVTYEEQLIKARFYRETWFNTWPEMRLFFRRVQDMIQKNGGTIRQLQSDRIRGDCRFTAACNTFFQGRVADAMKEILFMLSDESFTGRCVSKHVHGGSNICTVYGRSILWGSRISMFLHDEPIMEHPLHDRPSLRATRQQQLMVAGLSNWMKDIPCTSTPVLMHRWYKGAEPVFVDGELVPSKPLKIDGKVKWMPDV